MKHFKYEPRGKRRIHSKPSGYEIQHCRWWIERELAVIAPQLVVALGSTAAQSLAGRTVSVLRERGPTVFGAQAGFVTIHPSYLLRLPDERSKAREYENFVADLVEVRRLLAPVHETDRESGGAGYVAGVRLIRAERIGRVRTTGLTKRSGQGGCEITKRRQGYH